MLLIRSTGIRVGECVNLSDDYLRSLGQGKWALHVPLGKLHTERRVPVDEGTRKVLARMLSLRSNALSVPLASGSCRGRPKWPRGYWRDDFKERKRGRKKAWAKLAPASMPEREVKKVAAELLRPLNQGLESIGSATNFTTYVDETYIPVVMPLMAGSTQDRYSGVIRNYLFPAFGKLCLRDLTTLSIQRHFSGLSVTNLSHPSKDKIRDVLSSILGSAVEYGMLVRNPIDGVRLPAERTGRRRTKPFVSPEQFDLLIALIPEPYATMVYVAMYTGLRVSELAGLRWNDIHPDAITIDQRYCRRDWGAPKSDASNATIGVNRCVIERIHRLKLLTVEVRAGRAVRKYKVVKSDGPEDLVFQSVQKGLPIRDNNILTWFPSLPDGRSPCLG